MPRGKRQPAVYLSHVEAERAAWEEERRRLTARIAKLEAKLERCVRLAASWSPGSTIADVRAAIETPASGERREGE
jgi:hypothetical protein